MPIGAIIPAIASGLGWLFSGGGGGSDSAGGIGSILGALLGAYGSSGTQGKTLQDLLEEYSKTGTSNTSTSGTTTGAGTTTGLQQMLENPAFAQFRTNLIPLLSQQLNKAQQPIYGDAQKAQLMNQLNGLAGDAATSLRQSLSRSGGLDSGLLSQGLTDIGTQRFGQLSNFFSQLPFAESEAQAARMNPLLQMATGWVGAAPLSTATSGTTSSTGTTTGSESTTVSESGTSKKTGTTTEQGPSFGKQLASDFGSLLGGGLFSGKPKTTTSFGNPWFNSSDSRIGLGGF